ncbi:hypothetical protein GCM10023205_78880 [Yinghuangia aomiensis]|uniref:B12-binding domain-containing protein n=1 Tax=Yinghuangia aomiensis TaxID=676205 RepID=A0ABP9IBY9_9ACTN
MNQQRDRLLQAVLCAAADDPIEAVRAATWAGDVHQVVTDAPDAVAIDPALLTRWVAAVLGKHAARVLVAGTADRRLLLVERAGRRGCHLDGLPRQDRAVRQAVWSWVVADLSGRPHSSRDWPAWADGHVELEQPDGWLSLARVDDVAVHRLSRPRVLLAALYHPEFFPLPRFPLGISDLARAARGTLSGQVALMDMQLGATVDDIVEELDVGPVDILGVSATFGQHDLLTRVLDRAFAVPTPPMVIAGGSLTARNEALLLERYPRLLIARSAGETTMQDLVLHWHGDIDRGQVHGIGYSGVTRGGALSIGRQRTPAVPNRQQTDFLPELDLLDATLAAGGVAQAEASRGCTDACSFCPRSHKGVWAGGDADSLRWLMERLASVFDRHPDVSRTLYLVDEEFIGRGDQAADRAREIASTVHQAGFRWESSCRVDQVVRPDRGFLWHSERVRLWRDLVDRGLRRCLFGVESGVDSVLQRFNKRTTGEQNALAVRTLSLLGVPTRFTYITYDQMMTMDELVATCAFQGRRDLLLRPRPDLSPEQVVRAVRDPQFVAAHATGRPFYSGISYLLVSMECLVGAAYTRRVQAAGLAGEPDPSMGRVDARFADWRIGMCSAWSQRWVDRHFAFDYTLKSLEKVLDGAPRQAVRAARAVIKDAAYAVLRGAIAEARSTDIGADHADLDCRLHVLLEGELAELRRSMAYTVPRVRTALSAKTAAVLDGEYARWLATYEWTLINVADPCGT